MDGVVTISSMEHSGLGRYGDALNPWGDLIGVARAWCVTKPGGFLLIDVPGHPEQDAIEWNWHRVYGPVRFPLLTSNWQLVPGVEMTQTNLTDPNHYTALLTKVLDVN